MTVDVGKSKEAPPRNATSKWSEIHDWADRHIRELRYLGYILGISGAALIVYSTGLHRRYSSVSDIPISEYSRRSKLRVLVHHVISGHGPGKQVTIGSKLLTSINLATSAHKLLGRLRQSIEVVFLCSRLRFALVIGPSCFAFSQGERLLAMTNQVRPIVQKLFIPEVVPILVYETLNYSCIGQ
jgi:hypothetical protein